MNRLISIDALRGFVMVVMLIDHIRETFYLHLQVSDIALDRCNCVGVCFWTLVFKHHNN